MKLIELDDVSLHFHVRCQGRESLKDYLLHGLFRRRKQNMLEVKALERIDLTVEQGERVGIIGRNGAGKSTLLKLLAGIYPPTSGTRRVSGRVSSLFDISLGFEPEANGWDNIRFRSYLQGETPRSVQARMQAIADFSELGEFLDMPVRYYSSGMLVRLAFSVATAIEPEILIVDEVLSAGDLLLPGQGPAADAGPDFPRPGGRGREPRPGLLEADLQPHPLARPRADPHVGPGRRGHSRLRGPHGRGCAAGSVRLWQSAPLAPSAPIGYR